MRHKWVSVTKTELILRLLAVTVFLTLILNILYKCFPKSSILPKPIKLNQICVTLQDKGKGRSLLFWTVISWTVTFSISWCWNLTQRSCTMAFIKIKKYLFLWTESHLLMQINILTKTKIITWMYYYLDKSVY